VRCGPRLFRDVEERNEKAVAGKVIWKSTGWEKNFRGKFSSFSKPGPTEYCTAPAVKIQSGTHKKTQYEDRDQVREEGKTRVHKSSRTEMGSVNRDGKDRPGRLL